MMKKKFKNLDELKEHFGDVETKEIDKQEVGMSFEPRTLTRYEVRYDGKVIGHYEQTEVYEKDCKTKVCGFGAFVQEDFNNL